MIPRLVRMRQPDEFREVGNPTQLVAQIVENGGHVAFSAENIKDLRILVKFEGNTRKQSLDVPYIATYFHAGR